MALERFHKTNTSSILQAPKLFAYHLKNLQQGWMIVEKLPVGGQFFSQPLPAQDRLKFLHIYWEYRQNFPRTPLRPKSLLEQLPADEFHLTRISRWFELANQRYEEDVFLRKKLILPIEKLLPLYHRGRAVISQEFSSRSSIWCHGHFKPHEVYSLNDKKSYLIDFAHSALFPEGYELAFIIWAAHLLSSDWRLKYDDWRQEIENWLQEMDPLMADMNIQNSTALMRASMIERTLGTILADVYAADRSAEEKKARLSHLLKYLEELI